MQITLFKNRKRTSQTFPCKQTELFLNLMRVKKKKQGVECTWFFLITLINETRQKWTASLALETQTTCNTPRFLHWLSPQRECELWSFEIGSKFEQVYNEEQVGRKVPFLWGAGTSVISSIRSPENKQGFWGENSHLSLRITTRR